MQSKNSKIQTRPIEDLIGRIRTLRQQGQKQIMLTASEAHKLADSLSQVMTRMVTIQEEIIEAKSVKLDDLKDPQKDEDRAKDPEWLVMLGVCTHLGCVPLDQKGDYNGWFCTCHGSHYDISGRIRKGSAPTNMEIPEYKFVDANTIKIG